MKTLARPALRSAVTSISTMAGVRIRALTERHPIKPTSLRCHSAWQLNLGRPPLIDAEDLFRQPGPPHPTFQRQKLGRQQTLQQHRTKVIRFSPWSLIPPTLDVLNDNHMIEHF